MGELSVNLCGIELDNPVIPASGTFGYGLEFAELYDINMLGTFSFKSTERGKQTSENCRNAERYIKQCRTSKSGCPYSKRRYSAKARRNFPQESYGKCRRIFGKRVCICLRNA